MQCCCGYTRLRYNMYTYLESNVIRNYTVCQAERRGFAREVQLKRSLVWTN